MTDLSQYKIIIADFDGTFCLHELPIDYAAPDILFEPVDIAAAMWFSNSYLNKAIYNLLIENGKKSVLLLTASGSKQFEAIKIWLKVNAPEIEFKCASVSSDCSKKQYIAALRKRLGLGFDNILLIDDDPAIVNDIERSQVCTARTPEYLIQGEVKTVEPVPPATVQGQLIKLTQEKTTPVAKVVTTSKPVVPAEQKDNSSSIGTIEPRRIVLKEEGIFQTKSRLFSKDTVVPSGHFYLFAKYYWQGGKVYQELLKYQGKPDAYYETDNNKARNIARALAVKNCKDGCDDGNILCVVVLEANLVAGNKPSVQKIIFAVPDGEVSEREIEHRGLIMVSQRGMN